MKLSLITENVDPSNPLKHLNTRFMKKLRAALKDLELAKPGSMPPDPIPAASNVYYNIRENIKRVIRETVDYINGNGYDDVVSVALADFWGFKKPSEYNYLDLDFRYGDAEEVIDRVVYDAKSFEDIEDRISALDQLNEYFGKGGLLDFDYSKPIPKRSFFEKTFEPGSFWGEIWRGINTDITLSSIVKDILNADPDEYWD